MTTVSIKATEEELPFVYRFTDFGSTSEVRLEIGDKFLAYGAFSDDSDVDVMTQIGVSLVTRGLSLLGHSKNSARMLLLLALGRVLDVRDEDDYEDDGFGID